MHLLAHSISAIPFIVTDHPWAAIGAIAPDLTWLYNEYRFRNSNYNHWHNWAFYYLKERHCVLYRLAHSIIMVVPLCLFFGWYEFLMGWCVHIALDLPTHWGMMQQQPLYPFTWKWKWVFKRYKK